MRMKLEDMTKYTTEKEFEEIKNRIVNNLGNYIKVFEEEYSKAENNGFGIKESKYYLKTWGKLESIASLCKITIDFFEIKKELPEKIQCLYEGHLYTVVKLMNEVMTLTQEALAIYIPFCNEFLAFKKTIIRLRKTLDEIYDDPIILDFIFDYFAKLSKKEMGMTNGE